MFFLTSKSSAVIIIIFKRVMVLKRSLQRKKKRKEKKHNRCNTVSTRYIYRTHHYLIRLEGKKKLLFCVGLEFRARCVSVKLP